MTDERLYRLLIPGAVFLLFFLGWLIADPAISVTMMIQGTGDGGAMPYAFTLGGALVVVAIGFLVSEIAYVFGTVNADVDLCAAQKKNLKKSLKKISPEGNDFLWISIFTHTVLASKYPKLHEHISRQWSHVIYSWASFMALLWRSVIFAERISGITVAA